MILLKYSKILFISLIIFAVFKDPLLLNYFLKMYIRTVYIIKWVTTTYIHILETEYDVYDFFLFLNKFLPEILLRFSNVVYFMAFWILLVNWTIDLYFNFLNEWEKNRKNLWKTRKLLELMVSLFFMLFFNPMKNDHVV